MSATFYVATEKLSAIQWLFCNWRKAFELKFDAGIGFVWMLSPDGKIIELVMIDPISIRFQINWEVKLSAEV